MLGDVVDEAARQFGDRPAFVDQAGVQLSYAELSTRSTAVASQLHASGVTRNSVVALTIGSGFDFAVSYLAAAKLGAITAGINPSLAAAERHAILDRLAPDLVIDAEFIAGGTLATDTLTSTLTTPDTSIERDPEQIVSVVFTSGTTGPPKGAIFRNRQLAAICEIDLGPGWEQQWGGGGPMLVSTQFAHVGFMTKLVWYLRLGMTMHVLDRWSATDVLTTIARERITTVGAVAPQLALMLRSPAIDGLDLTCVETIIAGGAASPPGLVRAVRDRFGAAYSIRYSSTESGGVGIATSPGADDAEALHTIGRPRPGVEIKVIGADGSACPTGHAGELCLRSGAVFDGYWNDPEATARTLVDGWLHTGDTATIDDHGLVRLTGRTKEMYIRGGYNVAPAEVEAVLSEHPSVHTVAIAARADEVMGEIGVAIVTQHHGAPTITLAELRSFAADRLAKWKLPEDLIVIDELPLTPMQKVDRAALARLSNARPPMVDGADPSSSGGDS